MIRRHAGALVAAAFLIVGIASVRTWGMTWDEPESYRAGVGNLRLVGAALRGAPLPAWPWHELPGYQFAADAARAAIALPLDALLGEPRSPLGFHLVNLLMTSLAILIVSMLARDEGALPSLGPLAAGLLVLQPKLVAHSQINPKDVIALLVWSVAVWLLARAARRRRLRDFALLGVGIGVAVASHVTALLLAPLAVGWVAATAPAEGERRWRHSLGLGLAAVLAALTALLLWPWLWADPLARALGLVRHLESFDVAMRVLYLGQLYRPTELPWHYGLVSLLLATPLPVLVLAASGLARAVRGGEAARLARLAAAWLLLLVAADAHAPAHYDGARHLLPALPALALLAAVGARDLLAWARARGSHVRATTTVALVASLVVVATQILGMHPYEDAFLNLPARLWLAPEAQRKVELEYWGNTYREASAWVLAHTTPDTLVLVPIAPDAMKPWLTGKRTVVFADHAFDDGQSQVLVVMAREAWYTQRLRELMARQQPVYRIRRQGSTLLAIYAVR